MNILDNCALFRVFLLKVPELRIHLWNHIFHISCSEKIVNAPDATCPICGTPLIGYEVIVRNTKNTARGRKIIVAATNKGVNWVQIASTLNILLESIITPKPNFTGLLDLYNYNALQMMLSEILLPVSELIILQLN